MRQMFKEKEFFTHAGWRDFLRHAVSVAPVRPFRDHDGAPAILMRHDVDLSLEFARALAMIEKEEGVQSTFFIMTAAFTYNVLADESRAVIREIAEEGFEIGLHFSISADADHDPKALQESVARESELLSTVCGQEVRSVSLHNPTVLDMFPVFDSFRNAYDPSVFDDECYVSDSCMNFRGKNPYEFILRASERPVQVLAHPMHFHEKRLTYPEIYAKHIKVNTGVIGDIAAVNRSFLPQCPQGLVQWLEENR